jgi:hypothetical protein
VTVPTMPGCSVQKYVKVPAVANVKLNRLFGAMFCELKAPPFAVAVCVVLSLFNQLTVVPTDTVNGLGL